MYVRKKPKCKKCKNILVEETTHSLIKNSLSQQDTSQTKMNIPVKATKK